MIALNGEGYSPVVAAMAHHDGRREDAQARRRPNFGSKVQKVWRVSSDATRFGDIYEVILQ